MQTSKTVVLLVKNNVVNPLVQNSVLALLKTYPEIQTEEVTHPEYKEFETMTSKDDVTVVMTISNQCEIDIIMKECKNIKWCHCYTTGSERILSNDSFRKSSITLTVSRGISAIGLSEFTIGAMIYFSRKYREWDKLQNESTWGSLYATDISRKKVTVVGYGQIGSKIGRICKECFEMDVVGVKNSVDEVSYKKHPEVEKFYKLDELIKACEDADFIVAVLPGIKETLDVFNMEVFKKFKKSAVFINVGRGYCVAEDDLIQALKEGCFAGAALDVFKTEPLPSTSPFYTEKEIQDKLLISCHKAAHSEAIAVESVKITKAYVEAYLAKQPFEEVVDKEKGY